MSATIRPGYRAGFYTPQRGGAAKYPSLWRGCISAWCPSLGVTGTSLRDHGAFGKHGVLNNSPAWVVDRDAYALDFTSSYVAASGFASVYPTKCITVAMWYKVVTAPSNPYYTSAILSCQTGSGSYPGFDVRGKSTTEYEISISIGGSERKISLGLLELNGWLHGAFTYDGVNCRAYRNGILLSTTAISGAIDATSASALLVGDNPAFTGRYFRGSVDDIRIYDRALSASEITALSSRRGIAYESRSFVNTSQATSLVHSATGHANTTIRPSYQSGFYSPTRGGVAKYPSLWQGCEAAWSFGLGEDNRYRVVDQSPRKSHGDYNTATPLRGITAGVLTGYFTPNTINFYTTPYSRALQDFTVTAWFYATATGAFRRIVDYKYDQGFWLGSRGDGSASWGGGIQNASDPYGIFLAGTLNTWNFIALQRRGATAYLYLRDANGWQTTSGACGSSVLSSSNHIRIGNSSPAEVKSSDNWGGSINEVRLYNYTLDFKTISLLAARPGIAYELLPPIVKAPSLPALGTLTINAFLAKSVSNIN